MSGLSPIPKCNLTREEINKLCALVPVSLATRSQMKRELLQRLPVQPKIAFAIQQVQSAPKIAIFSYCGKEYLTLMTMRVSNDVIVQFGSNAQKIIVQEQLAIPLIAISNAWTNPNEPSSKRFLEFYGTYSEAMSALSRCNLPLIVYPNRYLITHREITETTNWYRSSNQFAIFIVRKETQGAAQIHYSVIKKGIRWFTAKTTSISSECAIVCDAQPIPISCPESEFLTMISGLVGRTVPGFVSPSEPELGIMVDLDPHSFLNAQISQEYLEQMLTIWIALVI